jgi:hypothetical protein
MSKVITVVSINVVFEFRYNFDCALVLKYLFKVLRWSDIASLSNAVLHTQHLHLHTFNPKVS